MAATRENNPPGGKNSRDNKPYNALKTYKTNKNQISTQSRNFAPQPHSKPKPNNLKNAGNQTSHLKPKLPSLQTADISQPKNKIWELQRKPL